MKTLKISLAVLAIGLLSWGAYTYFVKPSDINKPKTPPNSFVKEVQTKTKQLALKPINTFCVVDYNSIQSDIKQYSSAGKIDAQWANLLLKDLEYTYVALYIKQANYVFNGSTWDAATLNIIKSENKRLMVSTYIQNKTELQKIQNNLNDYSKVVLFLSRAKQYAADDNVADYTQQFDVATTTQYIESATQYINNNIIVLKCTRIKSDLKNIQNLMYKKHLGFINNKVSSCLGKYSYFKCYKDYYNNVQLPVFKEIEQFKSLSNSLYNVLIDDTQKAIDNLEEMLINQGRVAKNNLSSC